MAIGVETGNVVDFGGSQNNSTSVNAGTESNRFLFVGVSWLGSQTISTITYDGDAMTLIHQETGTSNTKSAIYGLVNPSSGSNTLVVNLSSGADGGPTITAIPCYNVEQTSVAAATRDSGGSNTTGTSTSVSLTGVQSSDLTLGNSYSYGFSDGDVTWGSPMSEVSDAYHGSGDGCVGSAAYATNDSTPDISGTSGFSVLAACAIIEGAAEQTASGTPSLPAVPTASGSASRTADATGTPSLPAVPTASGSASRTATASGAPSAPLPTSSGSATRTALASGTPSIPLPTSTGSATPVETASGAPSAPLPTASGTATRTAVASGTPTAPLPTSTGEAALSGAAGDPVTPVPTASGTATRAAVATGTPSAPIPTTTGSATRTALASDGTSSTPLPTASGTAARVYTASGDPQLPLPTATASAVRAAIGSGTPSFPPIEASGSAARTAIATGTPSTPLPTATGQGPVVATGNAFIPALTMTATMGGFRASSFGDYSPTNDNAQTHPSNYEVSDFSGFRVKPGSLRREYTGLYGRKSEISQRHPQESVRTPPARRTSPSVSPEPDDEFIDSAVDPEDL